MRNTMPHPATKTLHMYSHYFSCHHLRCGEEISACPQTCAFKKTAVSRNAVKDTVTIAEIYIVGESVLDQFKGKYTLLKLAQPCQKINCS